MEISVNELKEILAGLPPLEEHPLNEIHQPIQYLDNEGMVHPSRTATLVFKKNALLNGWDLVIPNLRPYPAG